VLGKCVENHEIASSVFEHGHTGRQHVEGGQIVFVRYQRSADIFLIAALIFLVTGNFSAAFRTLPLSKAIRYYAP